MSSQNYRSSTERAKAYLAKFGIVEFADILPKTAPSIEAEDNVISWRCTMMEVEKPNIPEDTTKHREAVMEALNVLLGKISRDIDTLVRGTIYPAAIVSSSEVSIFIDTLVKEKVAMAILWMLFNSPKTVSLLTEAFCDSETKQRVGALLNDIADEKRVDRDRYVQGEGSETHLFIERLSPTEMETLMVRYYRINQRPWLEVNRCMSSSLEEHYLTRAYTTTLTLKTNSQVPTIPSQTSLIELVMRIKPASAPKSLLDLSTESVAQHLLKRMDLCPCDIHNTITPEKLRIPANLHPKIIDNYSSLVETILAMKMVTSCQLTDLRNKLEWNKES